MTAFIQRRSHTAWQSGPSIQEQKNDIVRVFYKMPTRQWTEMYKNIVYRYVLVTQRPTLQAGLHFTR